MKNKRKSQDVASKYDDEARKQTKVLAATTTTETDDVHERDEVGATIPSIKTKERRVVSAVDDATTEDETTKEIVVNDLVQSLDDELQKQFLEDC